jgi:hypothetical protein
MKLGSHSIFRAQPVDTAGSHRVPLAVDRLHRLQHWYVDAERRRGVDDGHSRAVRIVGRAGADRH